MIEQGFAELVQGNAAVAAIAKTGGFYAQLPKDTPLPSWSYAVVSDPTDYELQGPVDLGSKRMQVDCYGADGASTLNLANAIAALLEGYRGTLSDPDATVVQGCFHTNTIDFFDEASRSYRRMLEYTICSV